MEEILKGVASALQMDVKELTDLLKNEAGEDLKGDALVKAIADRVKEEVSTATDARFKAGQSEINRKIIKAAKAAGFQNTQNLLGAELVTAAIEFAKSTAGGDDDEPGKGELTKDKLEKHPLVKELIAEKLKVANEAIEATKAEFEGFKKQASRKERDAVLKDFIDAELAAAKVMLEGPQGTDKKQRIDTMLRLIPDNVGLKDGKPVFLDEDGNVETDNLGKPKAFVKWLVDTATPLFGIRQQDPGKGGSGAPPAGNGGAGGQGGAGTYTFADEAAFNKAMEIETDVSKRLAMKEAWVGREQ